LFLDIDAGPSEPNKPSKPYRSAREAASALLQFCEAAGMPFPVLVASGNGAHAYWSLTKALPPEEWERYARDLKGLCDKLGLKADPAPTTNVSIVLRTPGTHNRKNGAEKKVRCFQLVGPYPIESFGCLINGAASSRAKRSKPFGLGPLPSHLQNRPT